GPSFPLDYPEGNPILDTADGTLVIDMDGDGISDVVDVNWISAPLNKQVVTWRWYRGSRADSHFNQGDLLMSRTSELAATTAFSYTPSGNYGFLRGQATFPVLYQTQITGPQLAG